MLQRILNNYDLSIKIIYMLGTLGYTVGTLVMSIFPNVYVAMVMISTMGIISMSMSYCPYALLGQYHEMKEVCIIVLTRVTKYMMLPIIQTKFKSSELLQFNYSWFSVTYTHQGCDYLIKNIVQTVILWNIACNVILSFKCILFFWSI